MESVDFFIALMLLFLFSIGIGLIFESWKTLVISFFGFVIILGVLIFNKEINNDKGCKCKLEKGK